MAIFEFDDETDMKELEEKAMDDPDAQCQIAMRYVRGVEVERDYEEAFDWLEIAAKNNHPYAQFRLGMAYLIRLGVDRDLFEAAIWFSAAAAQGVDAAVPALQLVRIERKKLQQDASQLYGITTGVCCPAKSTQ